MSILKRRREDTEKCVFVFKSFSRLEKLREKSSEIDEV
jgi:hypothetical protein